ncbi:MAG TPA: hypothetical protein V6C64_11635 [Microcoleaceae cyanobacterium]|jgi:hypothetical protein
MDPDREVWLEVALYVAKTKEIQKRAAEIDRKLKAVLADCDKVSANRTRSAVSAPELQKAVTEDSDGSEASSSAPEATQLAAQYEQVLILIWK